MPGDADVLRFLFAATPTIPNHPRLPLVVYRKVFIARPDDDLAKQMEERFAQHGWPPAWRWGVYDFPHYHSTAHELLGVFQGRAKLQLGHTAGTTLDVSAGDVIVIPAGRRTSKSRQHRGLSGRRCLSGRAESRSAPRKFGGTVCVGTAHHSGTLAEKRSAFSRRSAAGMVAGELGGRRL